RQIGAGSLHIAHITKSEGGDMKPFGSVFWHNGARSTWFVKLADESPDGQILNLGFFNRKANLGRLCSPTTFKITFTSDITTFSKTNPAETHDLAVSMSVHQRMENLLRSGAKDPKTIAQEIDAEVETVKRTVRKYKQLFTVLEGGKVALL